LFETIFILYLSSPSLSFAGSSIASKATTASLKKSAVLEKPLYDPLSSSSRMGAWLNGADQSVHISQKEKMIAYAKRALRFRLSIRRTKSADWSTSSAEESKARALHRSPSMTLPLAEIDNNAVSTLARSLRESSRKKSSVSNETNSDMTSGENKVSSQKGQTDPQKNEKALEERILEDRAWKFKKEDNTSKSYSSHSSDISL
jgi:hypothetical protein